MYNVYYETHVHKLDGTYDRKIDEGVWEMVPETKKYECQPFWQNANKVISWDLREIKRAINHIDEFGNRSMLKLGVPLKFYIKNGLSHFQKITKVEQINSKND